MASGLAIPDQKMTTVVQFSRLAVPDKKMTAVDKKNDDGGTPARGSRQENDDGGARDKKSAALRPTFVKRRARNCLIISAPRRPAVLT
jgi:hypothetical protein